MGLLLKVLYFPFLNPKFKCCFHRQIQMSLHLANIPNPAFWNTVEVVPLSPDLLLCYLDLCCRCSAVRWVLTPAGCISFQHVPYFSHCTNHCSPS